MFAFLVEGVVTPATRVGSPATSSPVPVSAAADRTTVGTLDVPHIGLGTIAWSPETEAEEAVYGSVAREAMKSGLDFFDTAERYGAKGSSLIPAALAAVGIGSDTEYLGGDTESRLKTWARGATVATKFAPTPWRGDAQSVVEACRGSAERLGVESVALMQACAWPRPQHGAPAHLLPTMLAPSPSMARVIAPLLASVPHPQTPQHRRRESPPPHRVRLPQNTIIWSLMAVSIRHQLG